MSPEELKTWPVKIWLQHGAEGDEDCSFPGSDDVTWCQTDVHESDVKYVRADAHDSLVEALKELVAAMERYQMDAEGDAPWKHVQMMNRARTALAQLGEQK